MLLSSLELWWALVIGTAVILVLSVSIILIIVANQRRFIAAQKEKMEEIRKSEAQYSDLFDNVSDVVYVHSLSGKILQINAALSEILGYDKKEIIGRPITEFLAPNLHHSVAQYLEGLKNRGESSGLMHLKSKNGQESIFEFRSSIIVKNGKSAAVQGIARNVTEQKSAEKALRESEERFRKLVRLSPVPMAVHSRGKWVYVNDTGQQLIGAKNSKEVIGKPLLFCIKPEHRKTVLKRIRKFVKKGNEASYFEETIIPLKGEPIEVEVVAIPIIYDGKPAGQVVVRDITERKRLQEELARAQRLEAAGRVAGQIAHDFNNLLAPLTAYPTLIREDLPENHTVLGLVDEMESASKKIAEINQQLLTLGRRGHYSTEPININDLITRIINSMKLPEEIHVETYFTPDVFTIRGGSAQLSRALTNLIVNANESMNGCGKLIITTENVYLDEPLFGYQTIDSGEFVKIDISDSGSGIDSSILDKIFDPFYTTKKMDRLRGSGLGLSIVHGIIEDHNGYITVQSELGKGTTFSLYFPISRDLSLDFEETDEIAIGRGEKILIVDDDSMQRSVAGQLLTRLGYNVNIVNSGEEAVKLVKKQPHDLVILDMVLDGIDGAETLRQILKFQANQKAIILSGYAMSQRVEEALRLGAGAFVPKPVRPGILANAIRKELDKKEIY